MRKLAFFVLCENSFIPRIAPNAPPNNAAENNLDSGILQPWFLARLLSRQKRKNEYRLTKNKQTIMIVITLFRSKIYHLIYKLYNTKILCLYLRHLQHLQHRGLSICQLTRVFNYYNLKGYIIFQKLSFIIIKLTN